MEEPTQWLPQNLVFSVSKALILFLINPWRVWNWSLRGFWFSRSTTRANFRTKPQNKWPSPEIDARPSTVVGSSKRMHGLGCSSLNLNIPGQMPWPRWSMWLVKDSNFLRFGIAPLFQNNFITCLIGSIWWSSVTQYITVSYKSTTGQIAELRLSRWRPFLASTSQAHYSVQKSCYWRGKCYDKM